MVLQHGLFKKSCVLIGLHHIMLLKHGSLKECCVLFGIHRLVYFFSSSTIQSLHKPDAGMEGISFLPLSLSNWAGPCFKRWVQTNSDICFFPKTCTIIFGDNVGQGLPNPPFGSRPGDVPPAVVPMRVEIFLVLQSFLYRRYTISCDASAARNLQNTSLVFPTWDVTPAVMLVSVEILVILFLFLLQEMLHQLWC